MEIYLVGGAVRDKLLNYPSKDNDYVVVGATIEEMLRQGFEQVGKDFPVFLHPKTKSEYALARTERKSGSGYTGFEVYAAPDVSLVDDLRRRDLTINAMAQNEQGLIDPYGGQADLKAKVLRHVSENFKEDPLRVLRLARFAARYAHMGFTVAESTMSFMREMVCSGELSSLMPERVWQEIYRSLGERSPEVFFDVLRQCGALVVILPEIDALFGVPQPAKHHPEIDTGLHTMMVLQQAVLLSSSPIVRFAALTHDLGKALTPQEQWPSHHGHEKKGLSALKQLVSRLRLPNEFAELSAKVMEFHGHAHRAFELKAQALLKLLEAIGAFRQASKLDGFLLACEADSKGRLGYEGNAYPQAEWIKEVYSAASAVNAKEFITQGLQGKQIGEAIKARRIKVIDTLKEGMLKT